MANTLFIGQDAGSAKMLTQSYATNSKRLAKLREEEEEKRKKAAAQAANDALINQGIESGELKEDGSEKNIFDKAGDLAKALPGALISGYKRIGEGTAEVIGEVTGENQSIRDNYAKMQNEQTETIKLAGEKLKDKSLSAEERKRWQALLDKTAKDDTPLKESQEYNQEQIEKTDPVKAAAAIGSIGLDVVTGGALKAVAAGGKLANNASKTNKLINAANKVTNPNGLKQGVASGATLGAGYGALAEFEDKGSEGTIGGAAMGAVTGAALGGVLGGAIGGVGAGFTKLKAAKNPAEVQKAAEEIVTETRAKQDSPKQLGAGYREPAEIESDIMAIQNGEDANVFKYTDTAGNDVTTQVADFDKEIRARQTAIRDLQQQADGIDNNTGEATIPEGVDPSEFTGDATGRSNATEAITKLQAEVADLTQQQSKAFDSLGGVKKEVDTELAKARFSELQDELAKSTEFQEGVRSAIVREEAQAIDPKALAKEEAELKAGIVPEEMIKPFKAAESADDVQAMMLDVDPEDTKGFIKGVDEIKQERMFLNGKMDELYTGEKYDQDKIQINEGYNEAMMAINDMPEPVRAEKAAEINEQVLMKYDEIDSMLEEAAEEVDDVQRRLDEQDTLEKAMVDETRAIQLSDPDIFRPVDNTAVETRLQEIKQQKFLASEAPDPIESKSLLTEANDAGIDIAEEAKTNPVIAKAVDNQVETQAASILDNTGRTAGLGWFIGTPTKVIEKFGSTGKQVADVLRGAVHKKEIMDGDFEFQMEQWGRLIKGKSSTEKVAKALDGDVDALKSLTPEELQAQTEIKDWFKNRADEMGLPEDARVQDYLPHLFEGKEMDSIERALAQLKAGKIDGEDLTPSQIQKLEEELSGIDAQTQAYLASKNTYTAKNGFLKKRKGAKDYSLDLEKILTAYHSASSSTVAYKPAIDAANELTPALTKEQNTYVTAVFNSLQGETDTVIEKSIDGALQNLSSLTGKSFGGKGTTAKLSRGTRSAIYNATIGANVGSAIRNSQQMVNVFTEVGFNGVLEAAPRALVALKKNSPQRELLYRNGVLSNRQGSYLQGGAMPKFRDKSTKALWGMFNTTETLNRATAFFAGYDKHLAKFPNDIPGAEKAGADLAQKTNFKFSAIDIPVAMQGDMAKNFLQMQTYNVQQTQYITRMLGEADPRKIFSKDPKTGKFSMNLEPQMKVARFVGGNAAFFGTIGAATGMNWQEAVPFWNDVKAGEAPRSPIYQILFGNGKGQAGMVETVATGASSLFTGKWDEAAEAADTFARGAVRTLLPGGNQAVKSIEGYNSANTGFSTTGSGISDTIGKAMGSEGGNIRFAQGDDNWSKFKASILGQYSTEEGRDWVDDGMKNVPTNMQIQGMGASDYIKKLPRAAQEQYISYYSTKNQASEALKSQYGTRSAFKTDLVSKLQNGSINYMDFSSRMAEYNNAVSEQMAGYLEGNEKMPPRLRDDLLENMFIPVEDPDTYEPREKSMNSLEKEQEYLEGDYDW